MIGCATDTDFTNFRGFFGFTSLVFGLFTIVD